MTTRDSQSASDSVVTLAQIRQQWLEQASFELENGNRERSYALDDCADALLPFLAHEADQAQRIRALEQENKDLKARVAEGQPQASQPAGSTASCNEAGPPQDAGPYDNNLNEE